MELDTKDRRLLLALDFNARATDSELATRVGLSTQVMGYRLRRLEQRGIVRSYYPLIDHACLGQKLFRVALALENTDHEVEQRIIEHVKERASWMVTVLGEWDLWFALYAPDELAFERWWQEFRAAFGSHLKRSWLSIMTRFYNCERSFILAEAADRDRRIVLGSSVDPVKLDDVEQALLVELSRGARRTSLEISRAVGESERVVRYRIKRLEQKGVIRCYRPFIDAHALGMTYYKLFVSLHNASGKDAQRIFAHCLKNHHLVYATEAFGGFDLEFEMQLQGSKELFAFITELKAAFPQLIKEVSTLEYMHEHKVSYLPKML